ncbi:unnamed protein product [Arctia plantaginis]|uniref:Uncharacterized protein n=1 Tax=Arctia plantaginis TaxID=874455 RepID=A0A8S1BH23_ARCPL|nr:unnamed protein product [Arctia plantaginis]
MTRPFEPDVLPDGSKESNPEDEPYGPWSRGPSPSRYGPKGLYRYPLLGPRGWVPRGWQPYWRPWGTMPRSQYPRYPDTNVEASTKSTEDKSELNSWGPDQWKSLYTGEGEDRLQDFSAIDDEPLGSYRPEIIPYCDDTDVVETLEDETPQLDNYNAVNKDDPSEINASEKINEPSIYEDSQKDESKLDSREPDQWKSLYTGEVWPAIDDEPLGSYRPEIIPYCDDTDVVETLEDKTPTPNTVLKVPDTEIKDNPVIDKTSHTPTPESDDYNAVNKDNPSEINASEKINEPSKYEDSQKDESKLDSPEPDQWKSLYTGEGEDRNQDDSAIDDEPLDTAPTDGRPIINPVNSGAGSQTVTIDDRTAIDRLTWITNTNVNTGIVQGSQDNMKICCCYDSYAQMPLCLKQRLG